MADRPAGPRWQAASRRQRGVAGAPGRGGRRWRRAPARRAGARPAGSSCWRRGERRGAGGGRCAAGRGVSATAGASGLGRRSDLDRQHQRQRGGRRTSATTRAAQRREGARGGGTAGGAPAPRDGRRRSPARAPTGATAGGGAIRTAAAIVAGRLPAAVAIERDVIGVTARGWAAVGRRPVPARPRAPRRVGYGGDAGTWTARRARGEGLRSSSFFRSAAPGNSVAIQSATSAWGTESPQWPRKRSRSRDIARAVW